MNSRKKPKLQHILRKEKEKPQSRGIIQGVNRAAKPMTADDYRTNGALPPGIKYQNRRGKTNVADFIITLAK